MGSPQTKAGTEALQQASRKRKIGSNHCGSELYSSKSRRLTNLEVSDYIVANNIKTLTQLFLEAESHKQEGECDFAMFLFSRTQKSFGELLSKAWLLKTTSASLAMESISRIKKACNAVAQSCTEEYNGSWLQCAVEVLILNGIRPGTFPCCIC